MGLITLQIPQIGAPISTEDPKIASDLSTIGAVINGNLDTNNLSASAGITGSQLSTPLALPGSASVAGAISQTSTGTNSFVGPVHTSNEVWASRYYGVNFSGVTLTENNGHTVTMVWTGSVLQFVLDGTTNINVASDARLKTNVETMTGALNLVRKLRPVRFNWKSEPHDTTIRPYGFIAQEVQEVLPEAVIPETETSVTDENGNVEQKRTYLGIEERQIVAVLAAAVQELAAKVEALEAR